MKKEYPKCMFCEEQSDMVFAMSPEGDHSAQYIRCCLPHLASAIEEAKLSWQVRYGQYGAPKGSMILRAMICGTDRKFVRVFI